MLWRLPLRVERKALSVLLSKSPACSFSRPLSGTQYLVWTVSTDLADSGPGIRPLKLCWQLFEARVEHNAPLTQALSCSDGKIPAVPSAGPRLQSVIVAMMRAAHSIWAVTPISFIKSCCVPAHQSTLSKNLDKHCSIYNFFSTTLQNGERQPKLWDIHQTT